MMVTVDLPTLIWGQAKVGRALFVHGLTSSAQVWWRIGSELAAAGWQATAVDLRGHGSAPRTTSYRIDEMATDLITTGDGWDVVVGHSLGGTVSVSASVTRKAFCNRLILLDPVLSVSDPSILQSQLEDELAPPTVTELLAANPRWHPEDAFWKRASALLVSRYVVERVFADNPNWNLWPDLSELDVPTVVLVAQSGSLLGSGETARNHRVRFVTAEGCGHSIQRDDPEAVLRAILGDR